MKTILSTAFLFFVPFISNAQKFEELEDIELKTEEDYFNSEPQALACCDYILACRLDDMGRSKLNAIVFLLNWSSGAPYEFVLGGWGTGLMKKNEDLLIIQLAAIVKAKLENKEGEESAVQLSAARLVYEYIKNPKSAVKIKGYIKKFVAAGDAGTLEDFINQYPY